LSCGGYNIYADPEHIQYYPFYIIKQLNIEIKVFGKNDEHEKNFYTCNRIAVARPVRMYVQRGNARKHRLGGSDGIF
jgi:hypothetical protein